MCVCVRVRTCTPRGSTVKHHPGLSAVALCDALLGSRNPSPTQRHLRCSHAGSELPAPPIRAAPARWRIPVQEAEPARSSLPGKPVCAVSRHEPPHPSSSSTPHYFMSRIFTAKHGSPQYSTEKMIQSKFPCNNNK